MDKQLVKSTLNSLIFQIRGHNVMLDSDLANLYDTETKKLKQQVRRNSDRFPDDFMFELTESEKKQLLIQQPRLSNLKFSYAPNMVFSEQGVAMLSSVLNSKRAIYATREPVAIPDQFCPLKRSLSTIDKAHPSCVRALSVRQ